MVPKQSRAAAAEKRFPPLTVDKMTPEQKAAMNQNYNPDPTANGAPYDPNSQVAVFLRSPGMLDTLNKFATHVRDDTPVPQGLVQMAILIAGRYLDWQSPWVFHVQLAEKKGISQAAINSIAQKKRLPGMSAAEAALYDLGTEILTQHAVSDATFTTAKEVLGDRAILDLVGTMGVYHVFQMVLVTVEHSQTPPEGFISYADVPYPQATAN